MLLSIDPGKRACGCALWDEGLLRTAELVKGAKTGERAEAWEAVTDVVVGWVGCYEVSELAIEWPTTYGGRASRGDTRDLLDLSAVVGALSHAFHTTRKTVYLPSEWKHNMPTETILWPRCLKRLSPEEQAAIVWPSAKSLAHNCQDAIGIGLKHLGRM